MGGDNGEMDTNRWCTMVLERMHTDEGRTRLGDVRQAFTLLDHGGYPKITATARGYQHLGNRIAFWAVIGWDLGWRHLRRAVLEAERIGYAKPADNARMGAWTMQVMSASAAHDLSPWFEWAGWSFTAEDKKPVSGLPPYRPVQGSVERASVTPDTARALDLLAKAYTNPASNYGAGGSSSRRSSVRRTAQRIETRLRPIVLGLDTALRATRPAHLVSCFSSRFEMVKP